LDDKISRPEPALLLSKVTLRHPAIVEGAGAAGSGLLPSFPRARHDLHTRLCLGDSCIPETARCFPLFSLDRAPKQRSAEGWRSGRGQPGRFAVPGCRGSGRL